MNDLTPTLWDPPLNSLALQNHRKTYEASYERIKDKLIEEMSELTKELMKERYGSRDVQAKILAEASDVLFWMDLLAREKSWSQELLDEGIRRKAIKVIDICKTVNSKKGKP